METNGNYEHCFTHTLLQILQKKVETSIQKWRAFIHRFRQSFSQFFLQKNHNLWIRKKNCFIFVTNTRTKQIKN